MIAVNDIYASIQGEGVLTGTPMVVVRLQGCGVGCPWCDTKETWRKEPSHQGISYPAVAGTGPEWAYVTPQETAAIARSVARKTGWALITGGEPAEQELADLVNYLHREGFSVALETSGTADGFVKSDIDWVCISPKFDMPGGKQVNLSLLAYADELKVVIANEADVQRLESIIRDRKITCDCIVSVQPVSLNAKITDWCVRLCIEHNWRLSVQTHRFINVR